MSIAIYKSIACVLNYLLSTNEDLKTGATYGQSEQQSAPAGPGCSCRAMPSAEPCLCTTTRAQSITKHRQNNSFYVQFMCLSGNQSLNSEGGAEKNRYLHRVRAEASVLQAGHQQMLKLLETKQGRQFCYLSPRSNNASLPAVW